MKLAKKTKRTLIYVGIIGGCSVLALTLFTISQYEKAKFKASEQVRLSSESKMKTSGEGSPMQVFWTSVNEDFVKISAQNKGAYIGTAIPAYALSILTLVSFGLILKDAEKQKEKEDNEVVTQM